MSEEEQKAIKIVEDIAFVRGIRQDVEGELEDLGAIEDVLRLIDKLQKQLDKLKEVDRQICCEELITKDKYQDILKENKELSESNFHFLEINQKLIEEKPIIKELTKKELNLLEKMDKLKRENDGYHKGFIDGITSSKYIIGNKKEELEVQLEILLNDNSGLFTDTTIMLDQEINLLEELLEMIK